MRTKLTFLLLACLVSITQMWADEAFRLHRYSSFQATPVTDQSIVFIGNSITNMHPWAEVFDCDNVINRGNSGGLSAEILDNVQSYITGRPAKVFIMVGTNDMNTANGTAQSVAKNVRQIVKHIQKESPSTTIYIESIMPSSNGSRTNARVAEFNNKLKEVAADMSVTYVDYEEALLGISTGELSYDNLHPHIGGNKIWADALTTYVGASSRYPTTVTVQNGNERNSYGARLSTFGQLPITEDDILFIGDELIHGGEWQELLGNKHILNRGTGWGYAGPAITFQIQSIPIILQGLSTNQAPKQILLYCGSDELAKSAFDMASLKTNYTTLLNKVCELAPATKISLVGIAPTSIQSFNTGHVVPFNTWLSETASNTANCEYIDVYTTLSDGNDCINTTYMKGNYLYGLGYQAMARVLKDHIDGCTTISEDEATNHYNLIAARKKLSNVIDQAEFIETGDKMGQYPLDQLTALTETMEGGYTLLANNDATIAQLEEYANTLTETIRTKLNKPVASTESNTRWYLISSVRLPNYYMTTNANGLTASETISDHGLSYWKMLERTDGTFDIVNYIGQYIVPTATDNTQLSVSTTRPSAGWSFDTCDVLNAFNVVAKVGTTPVNCALKQTDHSPYSVYNWTTDRTSDPGCQICITEAEFNPEDIVETNNVPFNIATLDNGVLPTGTWWYTMKIGNRYYLLDNGAEDKISLTQSEKDLSEESMWAFVGSDQRGYTIYNKKYGTDKVLAAPKTMTGNNGSTSYPILVPANAVRDNYEALWLFTTSSDIDGGYYMHEKSNSANKVNNRDGILAFWNTGADDGSTLEIEFAEVTLPINTACGVIHRDNQPTTNAYASAWKSTQTDPFQYTLSTPYNNISTNHCTASSMELYVGSNAGAWTFTVSDPNKYSVYGYSFKVSSSNNGLKLTPDGETTINITSTPQLVNVVCGDNAPSFRYTGSNVASTFADMNVTIRTNLLAPEPRVNIFEYGSPGNNICYRIPAIATANNGTIIAVADYRYGGGDIGQGRVSLRYRLSKDNGATWGEITTLQESRKGEYGPDKANDLWAGFGDPCIVADRESSRVLVLSCCGNVFYSHSTWEHHQGIARFRSEDCGETWETFGDPVDGIECHWQDISEPIYQKLKAGGVDVAGMFIGSGRIFQSRFTKIGDYYRLYCVILLRTASQGGLNYILYSDDFGDSWDILGGENFTYGVSGGDEPKAEELPDGSVLLSSRVWGGRIFNTFNFTDVAKGEGKWLSQAVSSGENGAYANSNSTNGEIMLVPVIRREDEKKMWLVLQSTPFGPNRANVGIHYKGLASFADFCTPAALAANWEGHHQSSYISSCYTTMTLQHDNNIGFLYEEETFGRAYTIVYKNYSIEQITDSIYKYDPDGIAPFEITKDGIDAKTTNLSYSNYVGGILPEASASITDAITTFKAAPNQENYVNITLAINNAPRIGFDPSFQYIIRNTARGTTPGKLAMSVNNDETLQLASSTYNTNDALQRWTFIPASDENDGRYLIYNEQTKSFITDLPADEVDIHNTTDIANAGIYRLQQVYEDHFAIVNLNPANGGHNAIHLPSNTGRMVCWTVSSEASQWFFEKTEVPVIPDAIDHIAESKSSSSVYDLQGRAIIAPKQGLYIVNRKKIIIR